MPYPNFHSCRLEDPAKYDTCRRGERIADKPDSVKGKKYYVIYCKKTGGPMEQQAFRYPVETWTESQARSHCNYNEGSFEAAKPESKESESKSKIYELRSFNSEFRATIEGEEKKLTGYGAIYNRLSEDFGGWFERIKPDAFDRALSENTDIKILFNHDPNLVLGSTKAGTAKVYSDSIGLVYDVVLPDTQTANDLYKSINRGDIYQSSFAFSVKNSEWITENGKAIRELSDCDLYDCSPVTYPMYVNTSVNVRSIQDVYNDYLSEISQSQEARLLKDGKNQERVSILAKKIQILEKEL